MADVMGRVRPGTLLQETYCIERLLGTGGMGEVYEATHRRLSGRYAIKVLLRDLALRPDALARFRREAEITSALHHPNIVQVIDFNLLEDGSPYLVMEFLEGVDLATRLEQGPLSLSATLAVVKQIAAGLAAAHGRGIVHRDLKPQNIFLVRVEGEDREEVAKVLDFGISKMKSASKSVTLDAAVLGTPQYMSPEQALGRIEEIDHATDQFALGAITYEMLTGRQAFVGDDPLAVMYRVVNEAPDPMGGKDGARGPTALEAILRKAMSKKKRDRYATVSEFARALAAAANGVVEISSARSELVLTPAPTMAFGHAPAVAEPADSPGTEPAEAAADAAPTIRRTPTTFRNAAGELSARPGRTGRIVATAAAVVALAVLMGLLTLSGRPVPVRAGSSPPKKVAARPTPPPAPPPPPVEAPAPLPVVEAPEPLEPPSGPPQARDGALRIGARRGRGHAGLTSVSRRAVTASAPLASTPAVAPSPQPVPPPPPPKPASDLVKGDDL
jgi:serine/threonine-protein kinase